MEKVKSRFGRFLQLLKDRTGVSTVEYALITVTVIAIIGSGAAILSGGFKDMFTDVEAQLKDAQTQTKTKATP